MKASTKMDIGFYIFAFIAMYFALLVEYNIDLLDYVREPAPKLLHPAERMAAKRHKIIGRF